MRLDPINLLSHFLGARVLVKAASGVRVEGKLTRVDLSSHDGLGNILVENAEGPVLIRGDMVHVILKR